MQINLCIFDQPAYPTWKKKKKKKKKTKPGTSKDWLHYLDILTDLLTLSWVKIFFLFFQEKGFWHFMQIVSSGDNLHKMSNPAFWKKMECKKT